MRFLHRLLPVFGLIVLLPASFGATILVSPPSLTLPPSSFATLEIGFSNAGDVPPRSLSAYDIQLSYDPALLILQSVTHGDPLYGNQLDLSGYGTFILDDTSTPGMVHLMELSFDPPSTLDVNQRSNFALASLLFLTLGEGVSPLTLQVNMLSDSTGTPFEASVVNGSLTVANVPEPAMFVLLGSGLAALGLLRRKAARAAQRD